jgi:formylglycine-generating enzyme required for sulfatase activity
MTDPTTGMELKKVTGGTFTMGDTFGDGDTNEQPTHQVTVSDFYIGTYEVTQGQWQAVMGNNPSYFSSCGSNCPVEQVSWEDVQTFIARLNQKSGKNYRLPTEAEWEYAARSGGQSEKYSGSNSVGGVAWYDSNSGSTTHSVGLKQGNGLGLYDMSGNVWEWVNDWYGGYSNSSTLQTNPTGPTTGSNRVVRGGSWYDDAGDARASYRNYYISYYSSDMGFRLAL